MIAQPSPKTEPPSSSMRPTRGSYFVHALLALSLLYYAILMLDLVFYSKFVVCRQT